MFAARLTRRRLFALLGMSAGAVSAGVLGGCRGDQSRPRAAGGRPAPLPTAGSSPSPSEPGGTALLIAVLTGERHLIATYDAALAAHPRLHHRLAPVRAEHARHAEVLRAALGGVAPAAPAVVSASPSGRHGQSAARMPRSRAATLRRLRAAEHSAAQRTTHACLAAPPERATLLGSIAASESSHVVALG